VKRRRRSLVQAGKPPKTFVFWGGRLCLDFANTIHDSHLPGGKLHRWHDICEFLDAASRARVHVSDAALLESYASLGVRAKSRRGDMDEALRLRAAIRHIAADLEAKRAPRASAVAIVNRLLQEDEGCSALVPDPRTGWRLMHLPGRDSALRELIPIARSAAMLVADVSVSGRVRKCANPACPLLFHDDSRTRHRRWCSMAVCGNRAKVAAHHRRKLKRSRTA
jgi:predicted RNA-binding Zn ribbon-like protein